MSCQIYAHLLEIINREEEEELGNIKDLTIYLMQRSKDASFSVWYMRGETSNDDDWSR